MKALISISEQQLEALNRLVTTGVVSIDSWQAEKSPDVRAAHEWLNDARRALADADEQDPSPLGWTVGCIDQDGSGYVAEPAVQQTPAEVLDQVASHLKDSCWEGCELTISPTTLRQLQHPTLEVIQ